MLDCKKAMEIVKHEIKGSDIEESPIGGVLDIGDRWAVVLDLSSMCTSDGIMPPGLCGTIGVDKQTGETGYITIPPVENIELLSNGKIVYEKEHFFEDEEE